MSPAPSPGKRFDLPDDIPAPRALRLEASPRLVLLANHDRDEEGRTLEKRVLPFARLHMPGEARVVGARHGAECA